MEAEYIRQLKGYNDAALYKLSKPLTFGFDSHPAYKTDYVVVSVGKKFISSKPIDNQEVWVSIYPSTKDAKILSWTNRVKLMNSDNHETVLKSKGYTVVIDKIAGKD